MASTSVGGKVDAVLGNLIVGEGRAQFADGAALLGETRQEKGDTYEGVAAIVALRIDDAAIAVATNHSTYLLHLRGDIDLAYSCCRVLATVLHGDIAEGAGATQVGNGVALSMAQYVVGHADKGVLFAEHHTILADESQTVDIGIDHDTEIEVAALHAIHDAMKVLLQRLRVMGKVACTLAVENLVVDTQLLEQLGQDDASYRVDGIYADAELALADSLAVDELQTQHRVDVALVIAVVDGAGAKFVDLSIVEVFFLGHAQNLSAIGSREEFALAVEQLQGVPLTGVMRGGDDDAAIGTCHADCQLSGRRCGIADIDDVVAHTHQGSNDDVAHHQA